MVFLLCLGLTMFLGSYAVLSWAILQPRKRRPVPTSNEEFLRARRLGLRVPVSTRREPGISRRVLGYTFVGVMYVVGAALSLYAAHRL